MPGVHVAPPAHGFDPAGQAHGPVVAQHLTQRVIGGSFDWLFIAAGVIVSQGVQVGEDNALFNELVKDVADAHEPLMGVFPPAIKLACLFGQESVLPLIPGQVGLQPYLCRLQVTHT